MDLKKLTEMAQQQRTAEEETTQLITPAAKPQPEPIYVPIEDDEPEQIPEDGYTPAETEDIVFSTASRCSGRKPKSFVRFSAFSV